MERLTKRDHEGLYYPYCFECCHGHPDAVACLSCTFDGKIIERLAAYEDTGLEPEEVKDMADNAETRLLTWFENRYGFPIGELMGLLEAKQQARLVVLPCKVGDTVWCITGMYNNTIKPAKVREFVIADGGILDLCVETDNRICYQDSFNSFFLTREEAERAMEGGTDNA